MISHLHMGVEVEVILELMVIRPVLVLGTHPSGDLQVKV
jgi:hypothetical protein